MRKLQHPTLGEVDVLLEVMHKEKHFYLISQKMVIIPEKPGYWWRRERKEIPAQSFDRKFTVHHYCMWGNTNDPQKMGTTKLTTPSGRKPASNRINKMFLEMVANSEELTFTK